MVQVPPSSGGNSVTDDWSFEKARRGSVRINPVWLPYLGSEESWGEDMETHCGHRELNKVTPCLAPVVAKFQDVMKLSWQEPSGSWYSTWPMLSLAYHWMKGTSKSWPSPLMMNRLPLQDDLRAYTMHPCYVTKMWPRCGKTWKTINMWCSMLITSWSPLWREQTTWRHFGRYLKTYRQLDFLWIFWRHSWSCRMWHT